MSQDANLKNDSDEIINIRCKELKYLAANRYTLITNEIYNGYMALEKYFEDILKHLLKHIIWKSILKIFQNTDTNQLNIW